MPITYEFIFRDGGSGSTPTSSGTIPVNSGQQPGNGSVDLPQSPPSPPTGAAAGTGVTADQVKEIVNRAAERQANNRPQPPAKSGPAETVDRTTVPVQSRDGQREAGQAQPTTLPTSKPEPRPPAGEATLDAIREATNRAGGRDAERQAPGPPTSQGNNQRGQQGERIEIPVRQPQQAPTSAQGPELPSQPPGQVTPQGVNQYVQQQAQSAATVQHPLPPPPSAEPPTPPPQSQEMQLQNMLSQLASVAGSAGVPGAGQVATVAGSASAVGAIGGVLGLGALWLNSRQAAINESATYSPEIAMAKAQGDVLETMRQLEQARKYGEEDASLQRNIDAAKRAGSTFWNNMMRDAGPGNLLPFVGLSRTIENLQETIAEFNRKLPGAEGFPLSPIGRFMSEYGHVPDPWPFNENKGTTIHDGNEYDAVITGL